MSEAFDRLTYLKNQLVSVERGIKNLERKRDELLDKLRIIEITTTNNEIQGCGKTMYATKAAANISKGEINSLMDNGKKKIKRAYHCEICDAWHLTSQAKWNLVEPKLTATMDNK